jgi:hypothetical protein
MRPCRFVERDAPDERHPLGSVRLLAPAAPRKYLAIGLDERLLTGYETGATA